MSTWGLAKPDAAHAPARQARRDDRSERDRVRVVSRAAIPDILRALELLPAATCIMTAAYESRRSGIMVSRVMKCSDEPACVAVAVPTGRKLAMYIRDSHSFGLNLVDRSQRLLMRKFGDDDGAPGAAPLPGGDPFDLLEVRTLVTGSPILTRCVVGFDCEVVRHYDLEADHEIYIGLVLATHFGPPIPAASVVPGASAFAPAPPLERASRPGEPARRGPSRGHAPDHGPADSAK